jgi:hypothetical protein
MKICAGTQAVFDPAQVRVTWVRVFIARLKPEARATGSSFHVAARQES